MIYLSGVFGLTLILNISVIEAFTIGVIPFLIGDSIKAFAAVLIAYKIK
jgi:biotin transporter BioY